MTTVSSSNEKASLPTVSASNEKASLPVVVIIGGGICWAQRREELANAPVKVILIDRSNHHLFQPLLYQVATAELSPADIAQPIRGILRNQTQRPSHSRRGKTNQSGEPRGDYGGPDFQI